MRICCSCIITIIVIIDTNSPNVKLLKVKLYSSKALESVFSQVVVSICHFQILWETQKLILATREFLRGAYSAGLKLLFLLQTIAVPTGLPGSILQVIKYSDYYGNHIASIKWL